MTGRSEAAVAGWPSESVIKAHALRVKAQRAVAQPWRESGCRATEPGTVDRVPAWLVAAAAARSLPSRFSSPVTAGASVIRSPENTGRFSSPSIPTTTSSRRPAETSAWNSDSTPVRCAMRSPTTGPGAVPTARSRPREVEGSERRVTEKRIRGYRSLGNRCVAGVGFAVHRVAHRVVHFPPLNRRGGSDDRRSPAPISRTSMPLDRPSRPPGRPWVSHPTHR